jgi:hypothetical protein
MAAGLRTHNRAVVVVLAAVSCSCGPKRLDFPNLPSADRIEIAVAMRTTSVTITDQSRIIAAVAFFERYHDGWRNSFGSGAAPVHVTFYRNGDQIDGFGVLPRALTHGAWTRAIPEDDVMALTRLLGVLPPK